MLKTMVRFITQNTFQIIMKEESAQLVEEIKIYAEGLVLSLEGGKIHESMDYVNKMKGHLEKVQEYLELKKSIPRNE